MGALRGVRPRTAAEATEIPCPLSRCLSSLHLLLLLLILPPSPSSSSSVLPLFLFFSFLPPFLSPPSFSLLAPPPPSPFPPPPLFPSSSLFSPWTAVSSVSLGRFCSAGMPPKQPATFEEASDAFFAQVRVPVRFPVLSEDARAARQQDVLSGLAEGWRSPRMAGYTTAPGGPERRSRSRSRDFATSTAGATVSDAEPAQDSSDEALCTVRRTKTDHHPPVSPSDEAVSADY